MSDCVFCDIIAGNAPATIVHVWNDAIAFPPAPNPVTPGHTLVIPTRHVRDAAEDPALTGLIAGYAAELAAQMGGDFQISVNTGPAAGQTVPHLHWHIVPRRHGDGLLIMPWEQQPSESAQ